MENTSDRMSDRMPDKLPKYIWQSGENMSSIIWRSIYLTSDLSGSRKPIPGQIWVWVKIRYPKNWMVNTKLD